MGKESGDLGASNRSDLTTSGPESGNLTSGLIAPGAYSAGAATGLPYSEGDPELYLNDSAAGMPDEGPGIERESEADDEFEQSRAQIEQTRAEMSTTIDAIQEKLSPQHIAQQAKDTVKEATIGKAQDMVSNAGDTASELMTSAGSSARGIGSTFIETIKANPVPAALAGIGLGWLFVSGRKDSSADSYGNGVGGGSWSNLSSYNRGRSGQPGFGPESYSENVSLGGRLSEGQDRVSDLAVRAQGKAGHVADQVQDTAGKVAEQVQGNAGHLVENAQYGARRAEGAFQQALHDNPLAVGLAAVAVGAAIGLSIPETDRENELLGETRDDFMHQAQHTVEAKSQQVQTIAHQAVDAAKNAAQESADRQGLTQK